MFKKCKVCKKLPPIVDGMISADLVFHLMDTHGIAAHMDREKQEKCLIEFIERNFIISSAS